MLARLDPWLSGTWGPSSSIGLGFALVVALAAILYLFVDAVDRLQRICGELAPDSTRVLRADLPAELDRVRQRVETDYDLIFADPPYAFTEYESLLASVEGLLARGGEVVVEHSVRHQLPE